MKPEDVPAATVPRPALPPLSDHDWIGEAYRISERLSCDGNPDPVRVERRALRLLGLARRQQGVACSACRGRGEREYVLGDPGDGIYFFSACDTCWGTGRTDRTGPDLRAESEAQEHLTTLARIAVWLEQGEREGAQAEFEAAWFARARGWAEALQRARLALGDDAASGQARPAELKDEV